MLKCLLFFISENGQDFYPGYPQPYGEFFMGQGADGPGAINFLPPTQGTPPVLEQGIHQPGTFSVVCNSFPAR